MHGLVLQLAGTLTLLLPVPVDGRGFIVNLGGDGVCDWSGTWSADALCLMAAVGE